MGRNSERDKREGEKENGSTTTTSIDASGIEPATTAEVSGGAADGDATAEKPAAVATSTRKLRYHGPNECVYHVHTKRGLVAVRAVPGEETDLDTDVADVLLRAKKGFRPAKAAKN